MACAHSEGSAQPGIRPVWSEPLLSACRKLGSLATCWAHGKDSDQTGRMPRLIWVFAGRTCHFVGFCHALARKQLSQCTTNPTTGTVLPAKTKITLYIYPVWQGISFIPLWKARKLYYTHAISEDSDQTARMHRMIWVFAGRTNLVSFVVRCLIFK